MGCLLNVANSPFPFLVIDWYYESQGCYTFIYVYKVCMIVLL